MDMEFEHDFDVQSRGLPELPLPSLLDAKLERRLKGDVERKNLLHRLVFIGKLRDNYGDQNDLAAYYDKMIKAYNVGQQDVATGLLLVYPRHCVHVVETFNEVITDVVRDIYNSCETDGPLEKAKVLVISHDVPNRLYNTWHCKVLDVQAAKIEMYEPTESLEKLVTDILEQLLHMGNHLAKQPKLSLKFALDSLHEKVPEYLPQQDIVGYLVESADTCIIEPREYLDQYEKSYEVVLDSDLTWPQPTRLFPYN